LEKNLNSNDANRDNLIICYENYTKGQKSLYPDGINVQLIIPALLQLQHDKEEIYGQSWRDYGHISAFLNVARKWSRIDKMMRRAMKDGVDTLFTGIPDADGESNVDSIVDFTNYGLLWVGYIAAEHPEAWNNFLKVHGLQQETVQHIITK